MKYVNKLTDEELTELYKSFLAKNEEFVDLIIIRYDDSIGLEGHIRILNDKENISDKITEIKDNYDITDYNIKVFYRSESMTNLFRKFMYKKFGNKYAKDYLFS